MHPLELGSLGQSYNDGTNSSRAKFNNIKHKRLQSMHGMQQVSSMRTLNSQNDSQSKHLRTMTDANELDTMSGEIMFHPNYTKSSAGLINQTYENSEHPVEIIKEVTVNQEGMSNGLERFCTTYADLQTASHQRSDSVESQVLYSLASTKNQEGGYPSIPNLKQGVGSEEDQYESALRNQINLESKLVEYKNRIQMFECSSKTVNKKYQELQKKYSALEKESASLKGTLKKVESERLKISEKWVKCSSKNKQDTVKTKTRNDELSKQLMETLEKVDNMSRENNLLKKSNDEMKEIINSHVTKIKALKSKNKHLKKEKEEIDNAAEDLFER